MNDDFAFDPNMGATAEVEFVTNAAGDPQLRRSWTAEEPKGTVLLVHGIAEHSGRYEHVARQFLASGFSVVSFDQRSHGQTGGGQGDVGAFSDLHDDIELRLDELVGSSEPVVLLGHSMGGLVVAGYVLDQQRPQPALVVLSSPSLGPFLPRGVQPLAVLVTKVVPGIKIKLPLDPDTLSRDSRVGDTYMADPDVHLRQPLGLVGAMMGAADDVSGHLPDWTATALVVHGADDKLVPPESSEVMAQIPSVRRESYDGLRHEMFNEPDGPEVVADVISWIEAELDQTSENGAEAVPDDE
ncbi:MAG: lysophospholipase [Acidimicrobiales bacterium]